jgi:hypothetical protein
LDKSAVAGSGDQTRRIQDPEMLRQGA